MKQYIVHLSNGLYCILVSDSYYPERLCSDAMIVQTKEYMATNITVEEAYTIKEIEE